MPQHICRMSPQRPRVVEPPRDFIGRLLRSSCHAQNQQEHRCKYTHIAGAPFMQSHRMIGPSCESTNRFTHYPPAASHSPKNRHRLTTTPAYRFRRHDSRLPFLCFAIAVSFVCHPVRIAVGVAFAVASLAEQEHIISTEAAHSSIVSSAAEKSASLPAIFKPQPATAQSFHPPNGPTNCHLPVTHSQNIASNLSGV